MRTVLKTTSEVFHFWANKVQSHGRCGSVSFNGDSLYSYNACIAKHLSGGLIAVTTNRWSVTTSSHQTDALRAVPYNKNVVQVSEITTASGVIQQAKLEIKKLLAKASVARFLRQNYLSQALLIGNDANRYAAALDSTEQIDLVAISGTDFEQVKKQLIADKAEATTAAAKHKLETTARLAANLQRWRDNDPAALHWCLGEANVVLRISTTKNCIETSHGANIPIEDAIALWPLIKRCRAGERSFTPGQRVGRYSLDEIKKDGSIVVGCHDIAYSEVEFIAQALGLIHQPEEIAA